MKIITSAAPMSDGFRELLRDPEARDEIMRSLRHGKEDRTVTIKGKKYLLLKRRPR